ncbi:MAG TPA: hypothetical protein PLR32_07985 [candidate division Zixibacteria bacterium]|nr:hypothetical protein [candidate division Zixibacteria bacterium]MDD4916268.1 hypothetical protein [candidate division Zixibacteria bacterium]MDM7973649.1 hypothetical protein [candidate division Zixibacteria bacterium]HOD66582.1 hypothetical protein [candidate division Zixibacteria bacterium]HOZ07629.1 hypothetical protein [candidate division Zixibacteria bacterium]
MGFKFACPNCGQEAASSFLSKGEEFLGRHCGVRNRVHAEAARTGERSSLIEAASETAGSRPSVRSSDPDWSKPWTRFWARTLDGLIGIVAMVIIVLVVSNFQPAPKDDSAGFAAILSFSLLHFCCIIPLYGFIAAAATNVVVVTPEDWTVKGRLGRGRTSPIPPNAG